MVKNQQHNSGFEAFYRSYFHKDGKSHFGSCSRYMVPSNLNILLFLVSRFFRNLIPMKILCCFFSNGPNIPINSGLIGSPNWPGYLIFTNSLTSSEEVICTWNVFVPLAYNIKIFIYDLNFDDRRRKHSLSSSSIKCPPYEGLFIDFVLSLIHI